MRNKFLMLSLLVGSFFTACSSDDDGGNNNDLNNDPIVGSWKYTGLIEDGEEVEISECDMLDTMVFNADGTFTSRTHYDSDSGCGIDSEGPGIWENKGEGDYVFMYESDEDEYEFEITFSNNNNTLSIYEKGASFPYTEIYTRVTE